MGRESPGERLEVMSSVCGELYLQKFRATKLIEARDNSQEEKSNKRMSKNSMNGRQIKCRVFQREAGSVGACDTVQGIAPRGEVVVVNRGKTNAAGRCAQSE